MINICLIFGTQLARMTFEHEKLAKTIKLQRVIDLKMDMRTAAKEIGISAATLSRIERGGMPDVLTFGLICKWLKKDMSNFLY